MKRAAIGIVTHDRAGTASAMPTHAGPGSDPGPGGDWLAAAAAKAGTKAGSENFPVALRLLPARYRRHLLAVYRFARTVDDAGDVAPLDQRPGLLHELADDVRRLYGKGLQQAGNDVGGPPQLDVVRGLADTVAACQLPMQLLLDLIEANEQDQVVSRYETFAELLDYCRLSANPVGRIVLYVFGRYSAERARLSDAICTGLQLVEHWQDVGEDMRAGRIYLPAADMRRHSCSENDLLADRTSPELRRLLQFESERARALIDSGAPLISTLRGAPRVAVSGYVAGGRAALAALARADYEVLAAAPRPGKGRTLTELIAALVRAR